MKSNRIKDSLALGAFAGIIATIPQLIFDYLSVQLGFSKYYAFQISGSIYFFEVAGNFLLNFVETLKGQTPKKTPKKERPKQKTRENPGLSTPI